jgi:hypothetical protein
MDPIMNHAAGIVGHVVAEMFGPDGELKARVEVHNLVTDVGDQYYGDRAVNKLAASKTITAITSGATATVTTSTAHGYTVGDPVTITGVTPTGYNGAWVVAAVPSATTFNIYVDTSLGVGTAFGTSVGLNYGAVTSMKLGTGSTAVAKNGAGAALVTYLTDSHQALDATYPQTSGTSGGRVVTHRVTYAAGKATTASPITEVVLISGEFIANSTSTAAVTIARALLTGIGSKGASDTLTITWTHTLLGA